MADYQVWLTHELQESHRTLMEKFGDTEAVSHVLTYPHGEAIMDDAEPRRILKLARKLGYRAAFTVNQEKVEWGEYDMQLGRYIVLSRTAPGIEAALDFNEIVKTKFPGN